MGHEPFSPAHIAAIQALKGKAQELNALLNALEALPNIDQGALGVARNELATGFMWSIRAITRPQGL